MTDDTAGLLVFLFDARAVEMSAGEITLGTSLSGARLHAAADPALVEMVEWCSSADAVRYALTPEGRRTARALLS